MRSASNAAETAFFSGFVPVDASLEVIVDPDDFDIVTIPSSKIVEDSIKISYMASTTDNAVFGSVIAPDLNVEIMNDGGTYDRIDFIGLEIRVYASFNVTGTMESVLMGAFICDSTKKSGNNIVIKALGKITKMDRIYQTGDISFPIQAWDLAVALCNECGLSVKATEAADSVWNTTMSISTEPEGGKYSYRQLLGYVCEIMAVCAHTRLVNNSEVVVLRWYTTTGDSITDGITFSSDYEKETAGWISGCVVIGKNGSATAGVTTRRYYTVKDNPIVNDLSQANLQLVANAIWGNGSYDGLTHLFRPTKAHLTILPNPLIEPLDGVSYEVGGVTFGDVYFGGITWHPQRNTELVCVEFPQNDGDGISPFTPEQSSVIGEMQDATGENADDISTMQNDISDLQSAVSTLSADYIIDQGTTGIWSWRKWNSGVAECWGTAEVFVAAGDFLQYQNVYLKAHTEAFPQGLFTATPVVNKSLSTNDLSSGIYTWIGQSYSDDATAARFTLTRPANTATDRNFGVALYAIGRWKE